jgi:hypothetical protein
MNFLVQKLDKGKAPRSMISSVLGEEDSLDIVGGCPTREEAVQDVGDLGFGGDLIQAAQEEESSGSLGNVLHAIVDWGSRVAS